MSRIRFPAQLAAMFAALLVFAGCATVGSAPESVNPQAQTQAAQGRVEAADAALKRGNADAALRQLAAMPSPVPPAVEREALDVASRAQLALGNRLAAARALARRVPLLPESEQGAERKRAVTILTGMGESALGAAYPSLADNDPVRPYVKQALARTGVAVAGSLPQLNEPVGTLTASATPQGFDMPAHVALLLPATGPVAVAGAAVRDGFFVAYFHTPATQERRPTIKVYDTAGTPNGAVAAYQQAVKDGASLVVGPLGRATVAAVLAQPSLPVPVLALNHPDGNQPVPPGSAEFGLMPDAEGAQLAAHMITAGLHAAIVFRADGPTASRTFAGFKAQFESLGGQVANNIVLPQGAVDFASQIRAALAGSGSETGIVVLLRPVQARLLLPQLRLARSALPVYATSIVYSGDQNQTANGDLDGVQFCDEPWLYDAQPGLPSYTTMASQLLTANGPAARLFAFGMDAYALMPYLGWLHTHPGSYVPGATGQLTMDAFGHVQRTPIWVEFQGGVARPVAAGLQPVQPAPAASTGS